MKVALKIGLTCLAIAHMTRAAAVELPSFADLVEEQGVKVVNISTKTQIDQPSNIPVPEDDPFYDFFRRFAPPEGGKRESRSLGLVSFSAVMGIFSPTLMSWLLRTT